jgi:hypothetical protein
MRVTKRADLLAKMKREEAERRAKRDAAEVLANDTLETVAADLFWVVKRLVHSSLFYTDFNPQKSMDAYDGLEQMRVRLAQQGIEVEWRDILPEEFKDLYGRIEE